MLLVTPGGGEDGFRLVATALEGLARTPAHRRPRTHVVCGPEMPERHRVAVESAAGGPAPGQRVKPSSDDMMSLIGSADVAVTHGRLQTPSASSSPAAAAAVTRAALRARRGAAASRRAHGGSGGLLRMVSPERAVALGADGGSAAPVSMRWPAPNPCRA
jgi:hypothetical protein